MKRKLFNFLMVSALAVVALSCSKDEEENKMAPNDFTYDGQKKSLKGGVVFVDQTGFVNNTTKHIYAHEITLYSEGFTFANGDFDGVGNAVNVVLTSEKAELETATYQFNGTVDFEDHLDFVDGGVFIDYNATTGSGGTTYTDVTAGKVAFVILENGNYRVDVEATVNGKALKASYFGPLTIELD